MRSRQLLALGLVALPLALAVVYGVREEPSTRFMCTYGLGYEAQVESYRDAAWWLGVSGQVVALGVLLVALLALRGARARGGVAAPDHAIGMVAAGVVLVVWIVCVAGEELDQPWYLGLLLGVPAGVATWLLLNVAARRRITALGAGLAVGWFFALPLLSAPLWAFAADHLDPLLIGCSVVLVTAAAWLGPRIGHEDARTGWGALALAAATVGIVVIPAAAIVIAMHVTDSPSC